MDFTSPHVVDSYAPLVIGEDDPEPGTDWFYKTPYSDLSRWRNRPNIGSGHEVDPENRSVATSSSLLGSSLVDSYTDEDYTHIRSDSPPPLDDACTNAKDERRYRMLLQHEFHPSCTFLLLNLI